jgi:multiple sugar transport system ATP-binding protein
MAGVSVRDLCVRYGGQAVIQGLDLEVAEGEFLVLLGPSGCGKSTLLHSIAGLIDVHAGTVAIGGLDMTDAEPSERGIGMVFQSYALYPTMTVERNLSFGLQVAGLPRAEIAARVQRAAQMLQLESLLQRKPGQLSGGQRQRVAIGRALVRQANVFLFDEPLSNLDAQLRTELRRELKLLHRALGSTMVYVTHDQVEAMTLATRIVVMRGGQVQQIGAPAEVYERPLNHFVAGFLGAPAMNFVPGVLLPAAGGTGSRFASAQLAHELDLAGYAFGAPVPAATEVVLGLRAEHISLNADGPFVAAVSLIEPMGNHQVVWLRCAGLNLSVLVHGTLTLRLDDRVRFSIDGAQASVFDASSGERL